MNELIYKASNGVNVKYKIKDSSSDCNDTILFIFSGFGGNSEFTYDFINVLSNHRSKVIWIKDDFEEHCSYYLCINMDFKVENAVYEFMNYFIESSFVSYDKCVVAGFSKGGSAALYYGLKYNFKNIIATVPQFHIGSYVKNNWIGVGKHILGNDLKDEYIKYLDEILPKLLQHDTLIDKNIYLFSSPEDSQYKTEIEPNITHFSKYENFNFIFTKSDLVTQHSHVTRYNLNFILSIIYSLSYGVAPHFKGYIDNSNIITTTLKGKEIYLQECQENLRMVADLKKFAFKDNLFFPEGVSLIRGHAVAEYSDITKIDFILDNTMNTYRFSIGKSNKTNISHDYFEKYFIDYSKAWFASIGYKGIDLSNVLDGKYKLQIEVTLKNGVSQKKDLSIGSNLNVKHLHKDIEYFLTQENGNTFIVKKNIFMSYIKRNDIIFSCDKYWIKNEKLHVEGKFIVPGENVKEWGEASYYLLLKSNDQVFSFKLGLYDNQTNNHIFSDAIYDYSKSNFTSQGFSGVDIEGVDNSKYELFIAMSIKNLLFLKKVNHIYLENKSFVESAIKKVAIFGACVSRDVFTTVFNKNYKRFYECILLQNQTSILSLMSPTIIYDEKDLEPLSSWDLNTTKDELNKTFLNNLINLSPDILIVDFFADARFKAIEYQNSFITLNEWKFTKTHLYKKIQNNKVIDWENDIDLIKANIKLFYDFLRENLPNTKIILNQARGVKGYINSDGKLELFNLDLIEELNKKWAKLDQIFIEICQPHVIDAMSPSLLADINHPFGKGYVHYEPKFYSIFFEKLNEI